MTPISQDTVDLFFSLLGQIQISPMDPNFDEVVARVQRAKAEVKAYEQTLLSAPVE